MYSKIFSFFFISFFVLVTMVSSSLKPAFVFSAEAKIQERDLKDSTPIGEKTSPQVSEGSSSEQKGGIYKVGRAFKKAGRGVKKGFVKTGHAFKKVGRTLKDTFADQKSPESNASKNEGEVKSSPLDHVGEDPQGKSVSSNSSSAKK